MEYIFEYFRDMNYTPRPNIFSYMFERIIPATSWFKSGKYPGSSWFQKGIVKKKMSSLRNTDSWIVNPT